MKFKDNVLAVKITAISVTIAAFLAAFIFFSLSLGGHYEHDTRKSERHAAEYTAKLDELMEARDYFGIYDYANVNNIRFSYGSDYYEYTEVIRAVESFMNIYSELLIVGFKEGSTENILKSHPRTLGSAIYSFYVMVSDERIKLGEYSDDVEQFLRQLKIDTGYYISAILYIPTDDLDTKTETQVATIIEEAYNYVWTEK